MEDAGEKQREKEPASSKPVVNVDEPKSDSAHQNGAQMEVDDEHAPTSAKEEAKQDASKAEIKESASTTLLQTAAGDEDDAVEY